MKIVQNSKENMLRSASDSTYIFLLKIKNSVWFLYTPVKHSTLQCIVVPCTLKHSVVCIPCYHHFP